LLVDHETAESWSSSSEFLEVRALVERYSWRYSVELIEEAVIADRVMVTLRAEGGSGVYSQKEISDMFNFFARCACIRLFLPLLFPDIPRLIYLDYDTVALCDIRRLDSQFDTFSQGAAIAMAGEEPSGGHSSSWYTEKRLPVAIPGGFNSGVILFNTPRLRTTLGLPAFYDDIVAIVRGGGYKSLPEITNYGLELGDQDILNVFCLKHPELLHTLTPSWNTLFPATKVWGDYDEFDPPPPCLIHFNSQGYLAHEPTITRIGNRPFEFVRDWPLVNPRNPQLNASFVAMPSRSTPNASCSAAGIKTGRFKGQSGRRSPYKQDRLASNCTFPAPIHYVSQAAVKSLRAVNNDTATTWWLPRQHLLDRNPIHIVMTWCSRGKGMPATVALKSILLADMQHGDWDSIDVSPM
jgi:lipopolysaccharide biosynthesis glycosyltransferase